MIAAHLEHVREFREPIRARRRHVSLPLRNHAHRHADASGYLLLRKRVLAVARLLSETRRFDSIANLLRHEAAVSHMHYQQSTASHALSLNPPPPRGAVSVMVAAKFAQRLKEARDAAGLSQQELAQAIGKTVGAISQMERGKIESPAADTLARLAVALDVSADELLGGLASVPRSNRGRARPRRDDGKHQTAMSAAVDREHWLWHMLDLLGYKTPEAKGEVAGKLETEIPFESLTPLLARAWLSGRQPQSSYPPPPAIKRRRA